MSHLKLQKKIHEIPNTSKSTAKTINIELTQKKKKISATY